MKMLALIFAEKPEGRIGRITSNFAFFFIFKNVRNKLALRYIRNCPDTTRCRDFYNFCASGLLEDNLKFTPNSRILHVNNLTTSYFLKVGWEILIFTSLLQDAECSFFCRTSSNCMVRLLSLVFIG